MECRHVYYKGRVQGVGFRYTTCRVAGDYAVYGYVRNLSDGRVEVLVEGNKLTIESFLESLAAEMNHYIRDIQIVKEPASGRYKTFDIMF